MELIDDGIHNCKDCKIYKEYGVTCSLQSELEIPSCKYCDTRMCCRSPVLSLVKCEQNTILDKIDEGEYIECEGIIPFNIKTKYCKHMDMKTMLCKVYSQRPIDCRISGNDCLGDFWVKTIKQQHEKLRMVFMNNSNEIINKITTLREEIITVKENTPEGQKRLKEISYELSALNKELNKELLSRKSDIIED